MKYMIWVICYLVFALIFSQGFKKVNRTMKNASALTVLLELFTGIFSLLMIPVFDIKFDINTNVLLTLLIVVFIYAVTDRLNIEARYGLDPSTFSMLKQLSTVFMIIFGFTLLKEEFVFSKLLGTLFIIGANIILSYDKGKFVINKYFIII